MGLFRKNKFNDNEYIKFRNAFSAVSDFKLIIARDLIRTTNSGTFTMEYMQAVADEMDARGLSKGTGAE